MYNKLRSFGLNNAKFKTKHLYFIEVSKVFRGGEI